MSMFDSVGLVNPVLVESTSLFAAQLLVEPMVAPNAFLGRRWCRLLGATQRGLLVCFFLEYDGILTLSRGQCCVDVDGKDVRGRCR